MNNEAAKNLVGKTFCLRVKRKISSMDLSQKQIAEILKVSESMLSLWLSGYQTIPLHRAALIAKTVGCSLENLTEPEL